MRKRIIALAFVICFVCAARPALAQPVSGQFVSTTCASPLSGGVGCTSASLSSSTTVSNYLIIVPVFACMDNTCTGSADNAASIASAQGDTFSQCFDRYGSGTQLATHAIWYTKVTSSGSGAVTITPTNTWWFSSFNVVEWTDIKGTSPCDATLAQYSSGSSTSISGPTVSATTECNEWLIGSINYTGTLTPTSSTAAATDPVYYKQGSSTATQIESLTGTSSVGGAWNVVLAVFKSGSGACPGGSTIAARRTPKNPRTGSRQVQ